MTFPIPSDETSRLAALYQTELLDTEPEQRFDDFVQLASYICGVPCSAISLIDCNRQWFKAIVGLDVTETSRDSAFCAHTILEHDILVVQNAVDDQRFSDNPLVTDDPGIRFYAGVPLRTQSGHAIGSLCLIDWKPRVLTEEQLTALRVLGRQVSFHLDASRRFVEMHHAESALAESEERFRRLSDAAFEGICVSENGIILEVNEAWAHTFGYDTPSAMIGLDGLNLVTSEYQDIVRENRASSNEEPYEAILRRLDGSVFTAELRGRMIQRDGRAARVTAVRDITERRQMEHALQESRQFINSVAAHSTSHLYVIDLALGGPIYTNRDLDEFLGYEIGEFARLGLNFHSEMHPDDRPGFLAHLDEFANFDDKRIAKFEVRLRHKLGDFRWLAHREVVFKRDMNGKPTQIMGTAEDITERKRQEAIVKESEMRLADALIVLEFQKAELEKANLELEELATTDGLTGLTNHVTFQKRLQHEVARARRYSEQLSLVMIDVDHFKEYNDQLGHVKGDEVLRTVALILCQSARQTDTVARYGGEEFVVIFPHTDSQAAEVIAERIRSVIDNTDWGLMPITVSVGVSSLRPDMDNPTALIDDADKAMYRSKTRGRNRVICAEAH